MKLKACNQKATITTATLLPSLCCEMGFYLDISRNQDATVKINSRLIFYRFFMFLMSLVDFNASF